MPTKTIRPHDPVTDIELEMVRLNFLDALNECSEETRKFIDERLNTLAGIIQTGGISPEYSRKQAEAAYAAAMWFMIAEGAWK